MNDREREMWVNNDESLYDWWKSERCSLRQFIRENRKELDEIIDRAVNAPPPKTYHPQSGLWY